ncbi:SPASM domain-containing protein [Helicobacter apodemus]|uniref:4Fe4S-binding SPASM domain-containing protein n=1 Tax=Helicobacter apodemus TaxID=135569 RepID=A0A2U8FEN7_9HELI|nr:SPASM domain-containing protein [Helicobacter apodemus]AWI34730.1 hypothetical protein CDV25_08095 [Helicobacter apodemus]
MIAFNYPLVEKEGRKVCEKFYDSIGRDKVSVGDVHKKSLEQIWNGEVLNTLRKECLE